MEKEPCHHLVLNCLHSTFAVAQLPSTKAEAVFRTFYRRLTEIEPRCQEHQQQQQQALFA